jgi:hypothetical protein
LGGEKSDESDENEWANFSPFSLLREKFSFNIAEYSANSADSADSDMGYSAA